MRYGKSNRRSRNITVKGDHNVIHVGDDDSHQSTTSSINVRLWASISIAILAVLAVGATVVVALDLGGGF